MDRRRFLKGAVLAAGGAVAATVAACASPESAARYVPGLRTTTLAPQAPEPSSGHGSHVAAASPVGGWEVGLWSTRRNGTTSCTVRPRTSCRISNDAFGGFTINGRQFPATAPLLAKRGDTIVIRFMNEGVMMHPWHLHGMPMRIVARDGYPLGSAAFTCDTLGVDSRRALGRSHRVRQPGSVGVPLPHPLPCRRSKGMFGMVTALVVEHRRSPIDLAPQADPMIGTILLATDLATTSELATERAIELASQMRARLVVVNVLERRRLRGSAPTRASTRRGANARRRCSASSSGHGRRVSQRSS